MSDFPLPPNLPPMSHREKRALKQQLRKQIRPFSVAMTDQAKQFYTTVGQGITHWSRMESMLVRIVAKLLGTSNEKAGLVMYSIINFYVWIDIIDQLFELDSGYPEAEKQWKVLVNPLKKENDIRVRLAHHAISQEEEEYRGTKMVQAYLRPAKFDMRRKAKALKPLTANAIVDFTGRVVDLIVKINRLLVTMRTEHVTSRRKPPRRRTNPSR